MQAVLFDYGQVLSEPPCPVAWAEIARLTGLDGGDALDRAYWARRLDYDRGTLSGEAYWAEFAPAAAIPGLLAADTALWTRPNQPMIDWARRLQRAGTRIGILSNMGDSMAAGVVDAHPWLAGFDFLLWSHAVSLAKPEPAIYRLAAEGLGVAPAEILFIDDREDNVAAAVDAGLQAVVYRDTPTLQAELDRRGLAALWTDGRA